MRKFLGISIMGLVFLSTLLLNLSCSDNNKEINPDNSLELGELPYAAQLFMDDHFAGNHINFISRSTNEEAEVYNVSVKGYEINFDKNGLWEKIEAKEKGLLPDNIIALLPSPIPAHVEEIYPGRGIYKIKKKDYGYKVELAGKPEVELKFSFDGNIIKDDIDQIKITFESLPKPIKQFISKHFPNINVLYVNKTDKEYKVGLTDGTRMDFTMDSQIQALVSVRGEGIPKEAILPAIATYLSKHYSNKKMIIYIKKFDGYFVELSGYPVNKILFDLNGNFIRTYK